MNLIRESITKNSYLSIDEQCKIFGVSRSSFYYKPREKQPKLDEFEETVKARLDYWHTTMCYLGVRRLVIKLAEDGLYIGRKYCRRCMREMGIYAVYPKKSLSKRDSDAILPYLLRNLRIKAPNQVWAVDITYVRMGKAHMYLTAVIDWYSRYIVGWALSDSLDTAPVLQAIKMAIVRYGKPEILNSDQGSQFTSKEYQEYLRNQGIKQSMDGKARWVDNVIIERWFRSLKCEYLYITELVTPQDLRRGIAAYIKEYNEVRPHQNLDYMYPTDVYKEKQLVNYFNGLGIFGRATPSLRFPTPKTPIETHLTFEKNV